MTRTARRRWTRELTSLVDGIAFDAKGPALVHCYDPPAGGKWRDDVIPGKCHAYDRSTGEIAWQAPCEIGYGRGFGAGFGPEGEVVMLGPSVQGHSIARMEVRTGELIGLRDIESFDEAIVHRDLSVCVSPQRVCGILTTEMVESWVYTRENERYHMVGRAGDLVYVVYTVPATKRQGVLCLHAETGEYAGTLVDPKLSRVHALAVDERAVVLVVDEVESALSPDALRDRLAALSAREDEGLDASPLALIAFSPGADSNERPLWIEDLSSDAEDDLPDVSIRVDGGKLYVARGAVLRVHDGLTGRLLGDMTLPGLDEFVSWRVSDGAGLLAEETRVSIFEVPD